ncbi:sensor histidine kinase [Streptomyces sp. 1331.2]|uniref:sensor histidine kinase n=1 Tax=Streptomyces sp. 1331.2 TaxID=1938835 RepID=UPI000BCC184E|nr:histidine kinase [Streptomyces sp. 1331.2]SOB84875.1 Signal transduction histidine kinase [Streptomyces sp. 1331.2]
MTTGVTAGVTAGVPAEEHPGPVAWAARRAVRAFVDGVRAWYVVTMAVTGLIALLAGPILVAAALFGPEEAGPFGPGGPFFLLVPLAPVAVWALCWATGGGGRAVGAALFAPGALAVIATHLYGGAAPGGRSVSLWLAPSLVMLGLFGARWIATESRRTVGKWSGRPVPVPYRRAPGADSPWQRLRAGGWLADPATWRDFAWALLTGFAVLFTAAIVLLTPIVLEIFGRNGPFFPLGLVYGMGLCAAPAAALWAAPPVLRIHERAARALLGPSRRAELAHQVSHLARTRADTIDAGAAELRRIERDLHDGAQARLVALGMLLTVAEQLKDDPDALGPLLAEARESSVKALSELRDLVRGIHPPVLADRGLADAVQATALDMPLPVTFSGELPGRAPAPVESSAYFAVTELLANVVKHAGASHVWIEIGHSDGLLRISVTDDGRGGADPSLGTGLSGTERRLAAFDGVLAISSPPDGPTIVNLEIPCALSSPKTSSSSGTA